MGLILPGSLRAQVAPTETTGKMGLEDCVALSMSQQSSLTAAQASLAAAQSALTALNRMTFAGLLSPDLPIRKQQACLGVQIAQAGVLQMEWETRYAVTRNYFSVIYAREQYKVVKNVVEKLDRAHKQAKDFEDAGEAGLKVTKIDVDNLYIQRQFYDSRLVEAELGVEKALAALREAIGLTQGQPLDIAEDKLPNLVENLDKDTLISQALAMRGEMAQVLAADQVTELEIRAQGRLSSLKATTFAAGADLHAKPVPPGVANTEYRPWPLLPEMPPFLIGHKHDRVQRAIDFKDRADAVVVKTEGLIVLDVEATYFKWKEGAVKAKRLKSTLPAAEAVAKNVEARFYDKAKASGEDLIRARTQVNQAAVMYNEALYLHALGLAALERVTAGGYRLNPSLPAPPSQP